MRFEQKYPVPLNERLLAPLVFREGLKEFARTPHVTARRMAELAGFGGYSDVATIGSIRAVSRLE